MDIFQQKVIENNFRILDSRVNILTAHVKALEEKFSILERTPAITPVVINSYGTPVDIQSQCKKPFTVDRTGIYECRDGMLVAVTKINGNHEWCDESQPIEGTVIHHNVKMQWGRDGSFMFPGWLHERNLVKLIKEYKFN